jgi:hypothetical protein
VTTRAILDLSTSPDSQHVIRIAKVDAKTKDIVDYSTFESVPWEGYSVPYEEYAGSTLARLQSPGELRVYDAQGRVTGWVNGTFRNEIPNATVYENMICLPNLNGPYTYEVQGVSNGSYGLIIANATEIGDIVATFTSSNFSITTNSIHQYTINWTRLSGGGEGVTIKIDSDNDGVFEQTFNASRMIRGSMRKLKLYPGYNLISLPVHNYSLTASKLLEMIGSSAQSVFMFNSSSQRYVSYDINLARFGINQTDFRILPDTGYFIYVNNETEADFQGFLKYGLKCFPIFQNYNLLGWSFSQEVNASMLIQLGNGSIRSIFCFNSTSQKWFSYDLDLQEFGIKQEDFSIKPGMGIFTFAREETTIIYEEDEG